MKVLIWSGENHIHREPIRFVEPCVTALWLAAVSLGEVKEVILELQNSTSN